MNPRQVLRLFASAPCFGLLVLLLAAAGPVRAQGVVGVTAILEKTGAADIYTYSATEVDYATAYYYYPDVAACLYDESAGKCVAQSQTATDNYGPDPETGVPSYFYASISLEHATQVPDTYTAVSYHYLWACLMSSGYYYDPYGYNTGEMFMPGDSGTGSQTFSGSGYTEYLEEEEIYLGYTAIEFSSAGPTITSINPTGISLPPAGSPVSGTIAVSGSNLVDVFGKDPTTAAISGGLTNVAVATSPAPTATAVTVNYQIANNASTGAQNLTLTTRFGTSPPAQLSIGDATPNISSVAPSVWPAAATTQFTIQGTGFGTNPAMTITGNGITAYQITGTPSDTSITAQVTIDPNAPSGSATVTVTSQGYGGSGFINTNPGQKSQSPSYSVSVQAAPVQIKWGTDCGTATQIQSPMRVLAGQKITLIACIGQSAAAYPNWTLPQGIWITGGFEVAPDQSSGQEAADPLTDLPTLTFYFVDSGNTWSVTCTNGGSAPGSVQFQVAGPTAPTLSTAQEGWVAVFPVQGTATPTLALAGLPAPAQVGSGQEGVIFQAATPPPSWPAGSYSWVQLLSEDSIQVIQQTGTANLSQFSPGPLPVLDTGYPYSAVIAVNGVANALAVDAPNMGLCSKWGEAARSFSATMYLLWTPAPAGGCTNGSACIPIPLGSISWNWAGDTINTLSTQSNATTWMLTPCSNPTQNLPHQGGFVLSNAYPQWSGVDPKLRITCP